MNNTTGNVGIT